MYSYLLRCYKVNSSIHSQEFPKKRCVSTSGVKIANKRTKESIDRRPSINMLRSMQKNKIYFPHSSKNMEHTHRYIMLSYLNAFYSWLGVKMMQLRLSCTFMRRNPLIKWCLVASFSLNLTYAYLPLIEETQKISVTID